MWVLFFGSPYTDCMVGNACHPEIFFSDVFLKTKPKNYEHFTFKKRHINDIFLKKIRNIRKSLLAFWFFSNVSETNRFQNILKNFSDCEHSRKTKRLQIKIFSYKKQFYFPFENILSSQMVSEWKNFRFKNILFWFRKHFNFCSVNTFIL